LGYDYDTRRIDATDEWWGRKLKVSLLYIVVITSTIYNYIVP